MIFRHLTQILCWILIVNSTVKNVRAISFDDFFEYFLDGIDESDDSSEELANSNVTVTCKNCTLSVECHNCTENHKDTQTTVPIQTTTTTQNNQQPTTSSLPTPTIPAPEVVGVVSSNNVPSENTVTTSQSDQTTTTTVASGANTTPEASLPQTDSTKSLEDRTQVTDDGVNLTTDAVLNSSEGVTVSDNPTT